MDKCQINIQSTKALLPTDELDDLNPAQEQKTNKTFVALGVTDGKGTLYTDLTGKFPVTAALVRACNNHEMLKAYNKMYTYLSDRNFPPKLNIMDNEASKAIKQAITKKGTKY
eukprot:15341444-Ditylum_brightwellii.AAC.1